MQREKYFQKMAETSCEVDRAILNAIRPLAQENFALYEFLTNVPPLKKRVEKKEKLRPYLLRLSYEVSGGSNFQEIKHACAAVEILNISTYIDNAVLDGKGEISSNGCVSNYLIAGRILRNLASKTLRDTHGHFDLERLLENIDLDIYVGQFADLNQIKYRRKNYENDKAFLEDYIDRCYRFTGRFMENVCRIGAHLTAANEEQVDALGEYGKNIGIMIQIINDIGDFVPPEERTYDVEKVYQDQYNDIKNGKLTLPVYYAIMHCSEEERGHLEKILEIGNYTNGDLKEATMILLRSGAIEYAKKIAGHYAKKAKGVLDCFESCEARSSLSLLTQMYRTNKYLATLRKYRCCESNEKNK